MKRLIFLHTFSILLTFAFVLFLKPMQDEKKDLPKTEEQLITLAPNDAEQYGNIKISRTYAALSETIKKMLEDFMPAGDEAIPLPNISHALLTRIVKYLGDLNNARNLIEADNLEHQTLIDLMLAVNYLDIPQLLDTSTLLWAERNINKDLSSFNEQLPPEINQICASHMYKWKKALILSKQKILPKVATVKTTTDIGAICFSPDSTKIALGLDSGITMIVTPETGEQITSTDKHDGFITSVTFSPNGSKLASGSEDQTIKIWDLETNEYSTLTEHGGTVWSISINSDGTKLASGSEDQTIKIWDLKTNKRILTRGDVNTFVCFSPDGLQLAAASDNNIKILDVASNEHIFVLKGTDQQKVTSMCFNPDGTILVVGMDDGTINLWNLASTEIIATFKEHSAYVSSLCFTPDGSEIVSCSRNEGFINLFNLKTKESIKLDQPKNLSSVSCSSDGKKLASACGKTLIIWDYARYKEIKRIIEKQLTIEQVKLLAQIVDHDRRNKKFDLTNNINLLDTYNSLPEVIKEAIKDFIILME